MESRVQARVMVLWRRVGLGVLGMDWLGSRDSRGVSKVRKKGWLGLGRGFGPGICLHRLYTHHWYRRHYGRGDARVFLD